MNESFPVLRVRGLTKHYGADATLVRALDGVDLEITEGELVAVMGPSGSGKSTLLQLAGGMDVPTSGTVEVRGRELSGLSRTGRARIRRHAVGYVFQDFNLVASLSALENVALPRELDGVRARRARREAEVALADVGLDGLEDRFPGELSGGQQQRVAIARALVGPRSLVLADEPTGALDQATSTEIASLLRSRCDSGAAGLLVTHDARVASWADRVVLLEDGQVVGSTGRSDDATDLLSDAAPR